MWAGCLGEAFSSLVVVSGLLVVEGIGGVGCDGVLWVAMPVVHIWQGMEWQGLGQLGGTVRLPRGLAFQTEVVVRLAWV